EIPGITPLVADFARRVVDLGCTVAMPSLFGTPGKPASDAYGARSMVGACVSREFACLATGTTSPVTVWLRALQADLHERAGGPGVGVVGMCLTGGFALAMMVDPVVVAPVLSQPSLPFPVGAGRRRDLGISDADLEAVRDRVAEGVCVLGLRFQKDPIVPGARFARLREELGDGFIGVELEGDGNPDSKRPPHSVLTEDLVDEPGHETREALQQVLDFFADRLEVPSPA
ncbi:MAG: dienelactone hydrolase, partial [Actinomycetota bacterium]